MVLRNDGNSIKKHDQGIGLLIKKLHDAKSYDKNVSYPCLLLGIYVQFDSGGEIKIFYANRMFEAIEKDLNNMTEPYKKPEMTPILGSINLRLQNMIALLLHNVSINFRTFHKLSVFTCSPCQLKAYCV